LERGTKRGNSTMRITDFRIRDAQQNAYVGRTSEVAVSVP